MNRGPGGHHQMGKSVVKAKNSKLTLKRLINYLRQSRKLLICLGCVLVPATLCGIVIPIVQGIALDFITITKDNPILQLDKMTMYLLIMVGLTILQASLVYVQGLLSAHLTVNTVKRMRNDLFDKIVRLPIGYIDTHTHGDIMSRMTNDIDNVSNTISQSISTILGGVFTFIGSLVVMIVISWQLTLTSLVTLILTVLITGLLSKSMRKYYSKRQLYLGKLNGISEEMISGCKTVYAYNYQNSALNEFMDNSKKLKSVSIRADILSGMMMPAMAFTSNFGYILIAVVGGYLALPEVSLLTIGSLSTFILLSKQFSNPITQIANLWGQIQSALAGAERVFEIYDENIEENKGTLDFDFNEFAIDFDNVDFSYVPGKKVLTDFTLHIKKGQKIALVGATGSGKTTVVNLLMRFYDIDSGSIKIDGVDIRDIKLDELRSNIGIVLQDTVLFKDTVLNNINYSNKEATFEEIKAASKIANSNYFVSRFADKYDTMLSAGGSNLSGGQRQLLTIARAVLADPKILILDEATSSVDTRTEKHIQDAMTNLMKNRTSLIIAHRLSTIVDSDMIVVLDHGHILEVGNHEELLEKKGRYYELYQTQFSGQQT